MRVQLTNLKGSLQSAFSLISLVLAGACTPISPIHLLQAQQRLEKSSVHIGSLTIVAEQILLQ